MITSMFLSVIALPTSFPLTSILDVPHPDVYRSGPEFHFGKCEGIPPLFI